MHSDRYEYPLGRTNTPCLAIGCEQPVLAKRLCRSHYVRERRAISTLGKAVENGAGHITRDGYRRIYLEGAFILEHRLVLQNHIGRELLPEETVHHLNGDRLDNRIENLELWSRGQPPGQRVEDKIAWAKDILGFYEPDALR